jgi:CheY-like chemotaxis protein
MNEGQTILVVDDSEDDLSLMRDAFKEARCNHPLQEVRNGEEAIAYLKGEHAYSDRKKFPLPIVVLLDLNMPKRNGYDVLTWVRSQPNLKRLAICILTASARSEDIERCFYLGATSYLVKPIDLETLAAMMRCLCDWIQINHFPHINEAAKKSEADFGGERFQTTMDKVAELATARK